MTNPQYKLKMIIAAHPGVGKTVLVSTIVDVPEMMPAFYIDTDGNTDSIESKCHFIDDIKAIGEAHDTKLTCYRVKDLKAFIEVKDVIRKKEKELPYLSYIADSISTVDWWSLRSAVEDRPEIKRFDKDIVTDPDYGKHLVIMKNIFYHFFNLDAHVIFPAHLFTGDKDDIIKPKLNGQIRTDGPGLFKQVGFMSTLNKKRRIHFDNYGNYMTKDSSEGGLLGDRIEDPTFRKIYDLRYRSAN